MTSLAQWITPDMMRLLAMALLHFVWQGAALAALAYVAMSLCRSASTRYVAGVTVLALMLAAPVGTLLVMRAPGDAYSPAQPANALLLAAHPDTTSLEVAVNHTAPRPDATPAYLLWLVEAWFAGVVLLSLRSAGGFLLIERLRRRESTPVSQDLLELC
jgi:bla regulator protein blaR1